MKVQKLIRVNYFGRFYVKTVEPMVDVVPTRCIGKFYIILN